MRGRGPWFWIAGLLLLAIAGGGLGALLWVPLSPPSSPTPASVQAPVQAPPAEPAALDIPLRTAAIAAIDTRRGTDPALFRLDVDPAILVLDFPDLHTQALMLNRVAALIERPTCRASGS